MIHLNQTEFSILVHPENVGYNRTVSFNISGSITVEAGDEWVSPVAFPLIDNNGNVRPNFDDESMYMILPNGRLTGEGTFNFGKNVPGFALAYSTWFLPSPGATGRYRLYTGVQADPNSSWQDGMQSYENTILFPDREDYVDITLHFVPVPEPASMAVLGLGAIALLRRKKKA